MDWLVKENKQTKPHIINQMFREALRMYPPVAGMIRRTIKPTSIPDYDLHPHTGV